MEINDLINMLTDGLDANEAAIVRKSIERDSVKAKASTLKQQSEYDTLQSRATSLQQELDDQGQPGQSGYKAGARSYQKWYETNFNAVQKLQADMQKYQEKYGTLDAPKTTPTVTPTMTNDDIQAAVDRRIQEQYAPRWSDLLVNTGTLVQKHMFAGRKNPIDFPVVTKLATDKYAGNLELAYDEWDRPEREKVSKAQEEERINKRVEEELAKRGASHNFPSGADMTPSALSMKSKADIDKYDPQAMKNELAAEWMKAGAA
jgi:hypothetical protein